MSQQSFFGRRQDPVELENLQKLFRRTHTHKQSERFNGPQMDTELDLFFAAESMTVFATAAISSTIDAAVPLTDVVLMANAAAANTVVKASLCTRNAPPKTTPSFRCKNGVRGERKIDLS